MLLAKQQEAGVALLAEDAEWLQLSEEDTEDVEVNMCFMGKLQQVDSTTDPDAPVSTSCSEDDEVHSKLFQETFESVVSNLASKLQKYKDKTKSLKLKLDQQQIELDNFSNEKRETFQKITQFVDDVRTNLGKTDGDSLSIEEKLNTMDYWKNLYFSNYALGSKIQLEKFYP